MVASNDEARRANPIRRGQQRGAAPRCDIQDAVVRADAGQFNQSPPGVRKTRGGPCSSYVGATREYSAAAVVSLRIPSRSEVRVDLVLGSHRSMGGLLGAAGAVVPCPEYVYAASRAWRERSWSRSSNSLMSV